MKNILKSSIILLLIFFIHIIFFNDFFYMTQSHGYVTVNDYLRYTLSTDLPFEILLNELFLLLKSNLLFLIALLFVTTKILETEKKYKMQEIIYYGSYKRFTLHYFKVSCVKSIAMILWNVLCVITCLCIYGIDIKTSNFSSIITYLVLLMLILMFISAVNILLATRFYRKQIVIVNILIIALLSILDLYLRDVAIFFYMGSNVMLEVVVYIFFIIILLVANINTKKLGGRLT